MIQVITKKLVRFMLDSVLKACFKNSFITVIICCEIIHKLSDRLN